MIRPTLHHINIKTRRLTEMMEWYAAVVGTKTQFATESAAWLTNDEANHRIAFLALPGLEDDIDKRLHTGLHHSAFEYASFQDLMASYERLRDLDIHPSACLDHGMTLSLYYLDPDQNYVELQCDVFDNWAASSRWMRTELQFAKEPIGTFFDPEVVFQAYRAGRAFEDIRHGIAGGQFLPSREPDLGF